MFLNLKIQLKWKNIPRMKNNAQSNIHTRDSNIAYAKRGSSMVLINITAFYKMPMGLYLP